MMENCQGDHSITSYFQGSISFELRDFHFLMEFRIKVACTWRAERLVGKFHANLTDESELSSISGNTSHYIWLIRDLRMGG